MSTVTYYGQSYPRFWQHSFPEIREEIPALFVEAGEATVLREAGTGDYLVEIKMHQPLQVRHECLYDGTAGIAINGTTGACIRWNAMMYRMPEQGSLTVWLWLDYSIDVFKENYPEGREVDIEELCQHYRGLVGEMNKVWEII